MAKSNFNKDAPVSQGQFRKWRYSLAAVALLYAGALGFVVGSENGDSAESRDAIVTSGKVVSVEGCNRDYKATYNLRVIVQRSLDSLNSYKDNPDAPLPQDLIQKGIEQNEKALAEDLALPDCREAATLLTDDPRETEFPPPYPLYPGSPDAPDAP